MWVKDWLMMVENGFFFEGGCSGSMNRGSTPAETWHLEDEVSSVANLNIVANVTGDAVDVGQLSLRAVTLLYYKYAAKASHARHPDGLACKPDFALSIPVPSPSITIQIC